jgi:hypothetical protein
MRGMRLLIACLFLTGCLFPAGCGIRPTGVVPAGDPAVARNYVPPTTVYFVQNGRLSPVQRPTQPGAPQVALYQLAAGPTRAERDRGLTTTLRDRYRFVVARDQVYVSGALIRTVDVKPIEAAQIVCTATAQPGIHTVVFLSGAFSGKELTCADVR